MPKKSKKRRRKDAPFIFPTKQPKTVAKRLEAARARRRVILARTRAGRALQAEAAVGADMTDLEHLPVIEYPTGIAPRKVGMRRKGVREDDESELEAPVIERPDMAPPVALDERPKLGRPPKPPPPWPKPKPLVRRTPKAAADTPPRPTRMYICASCGAKGHSKTSKKCPKRELPVCPKCNVTGHTARHCKGEPSLEQRQLPATPIGVDAVGDALEPLVLELDGSPARAADSDGEGTSGGVVEPVPAVSLAAS